MGIYRNDDPFGSGENWLDDYGKQAFRNADSIAKPRAQPQDVTKIISRLEPLDLVTAALFRNYKSTIVCAHYGWSGEYP